MNIYILDDDNESSKLLKKELISINELFNIICFDDFDIFINRISNQNNGIAFIDISMPKTSGIDVAKKLKKIHCPLPVVLYSGMPKEQYDVYEAQHVYFLEKPFSKAKLIKAIEIALEYLEDDFFSFSFAKVNYKIPYKSIIYFESKGKTIKIITSNGTEYFYDKLDNLEKSIKLPFLRANKSFLVNPNYISDIIDNLIKLKTTYNPDAAKEIFISRAYKKRVYNNELFTKRY